MKQNKLYLASILAGSLNLILSVIFILQMPQSVPTHFNFSFVCDGMGSPWVGMLTAALSVLMPLLMSLLAKSSPKNAHIAPVITLIFTLYFISVNWLLLFAMNSGVEIGEKLNVPFAWIIMLELALSFVGIGNYMPIVGRNNLLGIRTKYTLNNESCWKLTHRFAGRLWVITGLLWTAFCVVGITQNLNNLWAMGTLIVVPMINVILPVLYSYTHKQDTQT